MIEDRIQGLFDYINYLLGNQTYSSDPLVREFIAPNNEMIQTAKNFYRAKLIKLKQQKLSTDVEIETKLCEKRLRMLCDLELKKDY